MNHLYGSITEEECKSNQDDDSDIDFDVNYKSYQTFCGNLEVSFETANFEVSSDTDENERTHSKISDPF